MPKTPQQLSDELDILKQDISNYIANVASASTALKQQVTDLTAGNTALQAGIDAAFAKADESIALVAPPANLPPPTVLVASYATVADFNAAVAAYTGPEQVDFTNAGGTLTTAKTGSPTLAYFEQTDGSVTTTAPSSGSGPT